MYCGCSRVVYERVPSRVAYCMHRFAVAHGATVCSLILSCSLRNGCVAATIYAFLAFDVRYPENAVTQRRAMHLYAACMRTLTSQPWPLKCSRFDLQSLRPSFKDLRRCAGFGSFFANANVAYMNALQLYYLSSALFILAWLFVACKLVQKNTAKCGQLFR